MTDDARRARAAAVLGLVALVACWVLVFVGGRLQPDYDPWLDRISAAAAHGAKAPVVVGVAILLLASAYLAAAAVLRWWVGTTLGAALLVGAAGSTAIVAFARIDCPSGAAECARNTSEGGGLVGPAADSAEGLIHTWAVSIAYGLVAVTMLLLAVLWWQRGSRRIRAVLSLTALVASLATVPLWVGSGAPGGWQRIWLGILSAWLVLVLVRPLVDTPSPTARATTEEE